MHSSLGGAEVACWPLIPKFAVSNPAEAIGFLKGDKNPQHAFLRKGSKIILRHVKEPWVHIPGIIWLPFQARVGTIRNMGMVQ
jgi:hypothetical protein